MSSTIDSNAPVAILPTSTTAQAAPTASSVAADVVAKKPAYNPQASQFIGGDMTAAALRILSGADDRKQRLDMKLRNAVGGQELAAKSAGVKATEAEQKGSLQSAVGKFMAGAGGTALNAKLAVKAERLGTDGMGLKSATQGGQVANTISSGYDAVDQSIGGQRDANQAKIAGKMAELQETQAKMMGDGFKQAVDSDATVQQGLLDFAKAAYERVAQALNKAVGG